MLYQSVHSLEIIDKLKKNTLLLNIKASQYSSSFISCFFNLAVLNNIAVRHILIEELPYLSQRSLFDESQSTILYLGHIESAQHLTIIKELFTLSEKSILFFSNKSLEHNEFYIQLELNDLSTAQDIQNLWNNFDTEVSGALKKNISTLLMHHYKSLSVEQGCSLLKYIPFAENFSEKEFLTLSSNLFNHAHSLFELSTLFFSKKQALFFRRWLEIDTLYPSIFWLNYWSDQIFRAYCYVSAKASGQHTSKHMSARLPFSFVNKDYKLTNMDDLVKLHALLYLGDYHLKQGHTANITLIMHQWFLN